MRHPEAEEQKALFEWAEYARGRWPELTMMYHIPNGGRRDKAEAAMLKAEGVKKGVPDICLPVARCGYFGLYIELKAGKGRTPKEQEAWIDALKTQNYCVHVCYGWRHAADVIANYMRMPQTAAAKV